MTYKEKSKHFIENEKQFQLGMIPTEQSNPVTKNLSADIMKDTKLGVKTILAADLKIPEVVAKAMKTKEYKKLVKDLVRVMEEGKKFVLSSVGASGRMAETLGYMWRKFWSDFGKTLPKHHDLANRLIKSGMDFMTGGDRALVQSVENYEDYISFGRRQTVEANLEKGDILLVLAECSLSSSTVGSALQGDDMGISTYYFFTNPKDILTGHLERARLVFARKKINFIDLYVGNMAVAGSTRMQSASVQLLAVGAALELAIDEFLNDKLTDDEFAALGVERLKKAQYPKAYAKVLQNLNKDKAVAGLAEMIDYETRIYEAKGLVTYTTHEYLVDIMTDTTERQPTFTLPPFKKFKDKTDRLSWAYIKDPLYNSTVAWQHVFRRPIKGLDWTKEDYIEMKAAQDIIDNPPLVGSDQVLEYNIGKEDDPSRYSRKTSSLLLVDINGASGNNPKVLEYFNKEKGKYSESKVLRMGMIPKGKLAKDEIKVPVKLPHTYLDLLSHMMVKVGFNLISTGTMAKMGRVWGNWMIQVFPTNKKLIDRSTRIIANLADIPYKQANEEFFYTVENRPKGEEYKESYVVETLRRLGFDPYKQR